MKNYLSIGLLTTFFLTLSLILFKNNDINNEEKLEVFSTVKLSYYKETLRDAYNDYQKKTNLPYETVITNVNIGLHEPFYTKTKPVDNPYSLTALVNKYHYLDKDFVPQKLIEINKYAKTTLKMQEDAYTAFCQMAEAIEKENLHLRIISAYRSFEYQDSLYHKYLKQEKQEKVDTYSSRAGFSEHQTGLAVDIDNIYTDYNRFQITQEFNWMQKNAKYYGFILRYPLGKENITGYKYEPWHYRYVGKDIAIDMENKNLTYDEYYVKYLDK